MARLLIEEKLQAIADAINSTDVAQARIQEINNAADVIKQDIEDNYPLYADLERRVEALEYVAIKIISAALSVATAEKGSTVSNLSLSWTLNKVPTVVTVDAVQQALGTSGVAILSPVSANKTYSLVVGDGKNTDSKNLSIVFCNRVCYGVSTSTTYNSALINSLANKVLSTTKARTISVNAGAGQYVYYCIPSSLGTPSFSVGGFEGGFHKMDTINHTNASGFSENYDIYRSDNAALGSVSIVIT